MELLHEPGEMIAQRYRIVEPLGQGASGITYLAEDLQRKRQVALKAMSLGTQNHCKAIEQFEREAVVLAQLNHPAIPRYWDYFHVDTPSDRSFYIAQQLVEGQSLAALVQNGWRANEAEVRRIAIQLLEILVYLHERTPALIHRDIKPQNIIRRADGQVFLVDFGAVYSSDRTSIANNNIIAGTFGTVIGTFGYMAPEQFLGQAVPATDLYGLGATLLFLLTHCCPADLPTDGLKFDVRDRLQISDEFADWLEKMLEPDVVNRFSSAKEALAVLPGRQITPKQSRQPLRKKTLVKLGVATVAALAVLNHFKYPILKRRLAVNDCCTLLDVPDCW
ncbi:MAG: hypothetical protein Fur006_22640 [Coleofasciculaceae cyanobacterium]